MKKHLLLSTVAVLMFCALSCKKNSTTPPVYLPNRFAHDGTDIYNKDYKFDASNKLTEITDLSYDTKFIYDANDRLTEVDINSIIITNGIITYAPVSKNLYTYASASINEQDIYYQNGSVSGTFNSTIVLSGDRILKITTQTGGYSLYAYDLAGNLTSVTAYTGSQIITGVETLTYDNNKSRFSNIKGNSYIFLFNVTYFDQYDRVNNIASDRNALGTTNPFITTFTYNYTYNADGYPVSRRVGNDFYSFNNQNYAYTEVFTYTVK